MVTRIERRCLLYKVLDNCFRNLTLVVLFGHTELFYDRNDTHRIEIPTELLNLRLFTFSNVNF